MSKRAFITGINGQDGSTLAEFLYEKGYEIHGLIRRTSLPNTERLNDLFKQKDASQRVFLHMGDLQDGGCLMDLLRTVRPDEVYHLAAQSHVRTAWEEPVYTCDVTGLGTMRVLEAIRKGSPEARFFHPSSSEMFGSTLQSPQNEMTDFHPRNPYGVAKVYGHWITVNYRESYGLYAVNGVLYNHESTRRDEIFVSRKITASLARIMKGTQKKIMMGNLEARRDMGWVGDYVEAMWLMLQQPDAEDYVISTGQVHSIREFLEEAFGYVGLDYHDYVELDPRFMRPGDVDFLVGDSRKIRERLGWAPKVDFSGLVRRMVDSDLRALGLEPPKKG